MTHVTIVSEPTGDVSAAQMKFGDFAVVTKWDADTSMVGRIVKKNGVGLHELGGYSYWTNWTNWTTDDSRLRVRILPPGTKIEIIV